MNWSDCPDVEIIPAPAIVAAVEAIGPGSYVRLELGWAPGYRRRSSP